MANVHSLARAKIARAPGIRHSAKEKRLFWDLLTSEFTASGKNDEQFAAFATGLLGFPINDNHVMHARQEFDIPAHRTRVAKPKSERTLIAQRITALEHLVDAMRAELGMPVVERGG